MRFNIHTRMAVLSSTVMAANNKQIATNTGRHERTRRKIFPGMAVALCTLSLYINQAQGSQSEAEAVAALCDAIRYQAYNTMELRQFDTPKYKMKDMVDRNITNVNSRMTQYKLIDEAYMAELVSPERAGLVAHEFAESQYEKCMKAQKDIVGL